MHNGLRGDRVRNPQSSVVDPIARNGLKSLRASFDGIQLQLGQVIAIGARDARAHPPFFNGIDCTTAWPSLTHKTVMLRHTDNVTFLARTRHDTTGFVEQTVYRRVAGEGILTDGIQLMHEGTFTLDYTTGEHSTYYCWLTQPESAGSRTTTEFAIRVGQTPFVYADLDANICGYGHANMNVVATPVLTINGAGANILGTWGTGLANMIFCNTFEMQTQFRCLLLDNVTEAVSVNFTTTITPVYGRRETGFVEALVANVILGDSLMIGRAFSVGAGFAPIDRVKLNGVAYEVTPNGDGVQKPTPYPSPWNVTGLAAGDIQFYHTDNRTIVPTARTFRKVIQDYPAETLTPYQYCNGVKVAMTIDNNEVFKVFGAGVSLTEAHTLPTSLAMANIHQFDNVFFTQYLPGGAA